MTQQHKNGEGEFMRGVPVWTAEQVPKPGNAGLVYEWLRAGKIFAAVEFLIALLENHDMLQG